MTKVADLSVIFIKENGARKDGSICVYAPYKGEDGVWRCPVSMEGIHSSLPDIQAADSLQSLTLAVALIKRIILKFQEKGGVVNILDNEGQEHILESASYFF